MKKLIALLLALILVFSFVACSKEKTEEPKNEETKTEEPAPEQKQEEKQEESPEQDEPADTSMDTPMDMGDGIYVYPDETAHDPLSAMKLIWMEYAEEEKFSIIGGNMEANIMDVPGEWDMNDKEGLSTTLLIPAEQIDNVEFAATMIHMMNTNTFTGGVVRLVEGADQAAFAQAVRDAIQSNQWLCGMPEKLLIADLGHNHILIAYGLNDTMTVFEGHMNTAFIKAENLFSEAITG